MGGVNQLSTSERVRIIACLAEGNSLRGTARITGHHRTTIMRLLVKLGKTCADFQDKTFRNLQCKRIECDEIWAFVGCKERNIKKKSKVKNQGDIWTWVAIDSDTKLVPSWHVGTRELKDAYAFMHDLKGRLANRVQMTTDGYRPYRMAVEDAFGSDIDYGQLVKIYGFMENRGEAKYSKSALVETRKAKIKGNPDKKHISTSICERNNLTMRMGMRRFTRLTNAFSKKIENHGYAIALHYFHYNFCRIHQTLRITPAMAAGIADHVWSLEEMAGLMTI